MTQRHTSGARFAILLATAIAAVAWLGTPSASAHTHPAPPDLTAPGVVFIESGYRVHVTVVEHSPTMTLTVRRGDYTMVMNRGSGLRGQSGWLHRDEQWRGDVRPSDGLGVRNQLDLQEVLRRHRRDASAVRPDDAADLRPRRGDTRGLLEPGPAEGMLRRSAELGRALRRLRDPVRHGAPLRHRPGQVRRPRCNRADDHPVRHRRAARALDHHADA